VQLKNAPYISVKIILFSIHPKKVLMLIWLTRSYYRCAYSKEQGCPATKTVQQKESDGNGRVRLFDVDYYDQHTFAAAMA